VTQDRHRQEEQVKILLVDDRPENLRSLRQILARDDLEIITSESGNEALGLLLDHDFALVLLDVQMPGMDGFEMAELMRRHEATRTVPIIFVTAISKERQHLRSGYDAGAIDYIFKPIDPFIVRAKVAALVELKRSQMARERLVGELNVANRRLQEISDLKSDYLSAASHELRTPLTVIKEFCSLVHDEVVGPLNAEQKKCLGSAVRNCNRLANLVNDLLDLDSIESGHSHLSREKVALGELLPACARDFESRCAEAQQTLTVELGDTIAGDAPGDPANVLAAPDMITQVVVNLLGNACKFTPRGGEIRLRAMERGTEVVVEVQDSGPGIAAEDQARVFEKFAQLKRRDGPGAKGTGLGLPISRKIVELHGGRLELVSDGGTGCLFRFNLPLFSDESHLQAFVADGRHNPTGLPTSWTLVLLAAASWAAGVPVVLAAELQRLVRSSEDRVGQVVVDGQPAQAILLKTDMNGAWAFLARAQSLLTDQMDDPTAVKVSLLDVSVTTSGGALFDRSLIAFSSLNPSHENNRKGVPNV